MSLQWSSFFEITYVPTHKSQCFTTLKSARFAGVSIAELWQVLQKARPLVVMVSVQQPRDQTTSLLQAELPPMPAVCRALLELQS